MSPPTCPHNMVNFGLLVVELVSLRHPCKFQRVSHLGSVTARYSSSGCQRNFAVLNRGRHLYSTGRPSRWALPSFLVAWSFRLNLASESLCKWCIWWCAHLCCCMSISEQHCGNTAQMNGSHQWFLISAYQCWICRCYIVAFVGEIQSAS